MNYGKQKILLIKMLKVCGYLAKVIIPLPKRTKIGPKTINCIFIGFANNNVAYRLLVFKYDVSNIHVNTIIRDVKWVNPSSFELALAGRRPNGLGQKSLNFFGLGILRP